VRKTNAGTLYLKGKTSLEVAQDKNDAYQFKTEKAAQKALESLRDKFNSPSLVKYLSVERF
jgi:hypothetical protein